MRNLIFSSGPIGMHPSLHKNWISQALFCAALLLVFPSPVHTQPHTPAIKPGILLIASPQLQDPHFRETVVLICQHTRIGTLGLILNRPSTMLLSQAMPAIQALQGTPHRLFFGGPVQPMGILMLLGTDTQPSNSRPVLDGVYFGGDQNTVKQIMTTPAPTLQFRVFGGHASWYAGQLHAEIERGAWKIAPAEVGHIFSLDPAILWDHLYRSVTLPKRLISTEGSLVDKGQVDSETENNPVVH